MEGHLTVGNVPFGVSCCLGMVCVYVQDEEARKLNDKFVKNMQALEEYIIRKHNEGSFTRSVPGAPGTTATYSTCLIPGSAAGLTMRGVPYSVSI